LIEPRGSFVRGGKYHISVTKKDLSFKPNRKSQNYKHEKANGVERKSVKRQKQFSSDDWYKNAALSMAISAKPQAIE
jgi:hypothetical protein